VAAAVTIFHGCVACLDGGGLDLSAAPAVDLRRVNFTNCSAMRDGFPLVITQTHFAGPVDPPLPADATIARILRDYLTSDLIAWMFLCGNTNGQLDIAYQKPRRDIRRASCAAADA
jgi:hypothetical protein